MGKKSTPAAPPPPDPVATARAQTESNVNTAVANSYLGNADELGPDGSTVRYNVTGYHDVGGQMVPTFEKTTSLSPEAHQRYDQQNRLDSDLNALAINQTGRVSDLLSQPVSSAGLPDRVNALAPLPSLQGYDLARVGPGGPIQTSVGPSDFSSDRKRVEDALYDRLNPQLDRDRTALETNLVNQGFQRGTEAFDRAMDQFGRQSNDARLAVIGQGGNEQARLYNMALQSGQFANASQQQGFDQALAATEFNNAAGQAEADRANENRLGLYGLGAQAAEFQNAQRQAGLQEQLALRNQPINEISSLMNGGQVTLPQFAQYRGGTVADTPVGQYVYNTANLANDQYQQALNRKTQERNALYGALAGLGGAGLYGLGRKFG